MILDPDGKKLGFCDRKKELSYLRKGLAVVVDGYETRSIQLNFKPDWGDVVLTEEDLVPRDNICVVCGTEENLTKHHIIPSCYRCHLPRLVKDHNAYDIVAICVDDHNAYEKEAQEFKRELAIEFGVISPFSQNEAILLENRAASAASVLLEHDSQLSEERRSTLVKRINRFLGRDPDASDLIWLSNENKKKPKEKETFTHGVELVRKLRTEEDLNRFMIRWRMHFVKFSKPKFLPKGWSVDRKFQKS